MIRTLKLKFVLMTMFFVFSILAISFYGIFESNKNALYSASVDDLNEIVSLNIEDIERLKSKEKPKRKFLTPFFVASYDKNKDNLCKIQSNCIIDSKLFKECVKIALSSDKNIGTIKKYKLRFEKYENEDFYKIAFMDVSVESKILDEFLIKMVFIAILVAIICLIVAIVSSHYVVMPVERAWNTKKQFIADASHELKTPITILLANFDIIESNKDETIKSQMKWINSSKQELIQMKRLVEEMLFLAKSEFERESVKERVNISDIVMTNILSLEVIAYDKNVVIDYEDVKEDLYIIGEKNKINSLVSVILENACKYSYNNQVVKVSLDYCNKDKIKLIINNIGPVIESEDINNVFKRFYRVDKSRNRNHGGYGLGLSIAKKIADQNNIKILLESSKEKGTTFSLLMNKA